MNPQLTQANELYRSAMGGKGGMSLSFQISTLKRAIVIYSGELKKLTTLKPLPPCTPSLLKNLGLANLSLAQKLNLEDVVVDAMVLYHVGEAVNYLCNAWRLKEEKERKGCWGSKLANNMDDCFQTAFHALDLGNNSDKLPKYHLASERFLKMFGQDKELEDFKIQFLLDRAQHFFRRGVMALGDQQFVKTMQLIEYARQDIFALAKFQSEKLEVIQDLEVDLLFLQLSCDSVKFRIQADANYEIFSEPLNIDMMWDVLDQYKAAALSSREKDIENEAIALARQGRIYDKVFKLRSKAHEYYRSAFDLATCLGPRNLNKVDWFQEIRKALERFQREIVEEEERKKEKERTPYLEKMTEILLELKRLHNEGDPYKLMAHIFKAHPPKVKFLPYNEKEVNAENLKKTLIRAISYYHPDKQSGQDMSWRILCEEITKCLTARYECQK